MAQYWAELKLGIRRFMKQNHFSPPSKTQKLLTAKKSEQPKLPVWSELRLLGQKLY